MLLFRSGLRVHRTPPCPRIPPCRYLSGLHGPIPPGTHTRKLRRYLQAILHPKINSRRANKGSAAGILLAPRVYAPSITRTPPTYKLKGSGHRVFESSVGGVGGAASRG